MRIFPSSKPGRLLLSFALLRLASGGAFAAEPELSVKYEELTAPEFVKAVARSKGTVVIPIGILEKHGPHLPLGTDYLNVRALTLRAAAKEYTVVFPEYYFGQIHEAKHQPGAIALGHQVIWDLLQNVCDELGRNGFKKIMLVNGHGGNTGWLTYFTFMQNEKKKDYAVFFYKPAVEDEPEYTAKVAAAKKSQMKIEGHAGENETSTTLFNFPNLVKLSVAKTEDGRDLGKIASIPDWYTATWWYASVPNHYQGDASVATRELGEMTVLHNTDRLAKAIKEVKDDALVLPIEKRYYEEMQHPLKTKQ